MKPALHEDECPECKAGSGQPCWDLRFHRPGGARRTSRNHAGDKTFALAPGRVHLSRAPSQRPESNSLTVGGTEPHCPACGGFGPSPHRDENYRCSRHTGWVRCGSLGGRSTSTGQSCQVWRSDATRCWQHRVEQEQEQEQGGPGWTRTTHWVKNSTFLVEKHFLLRALREAIGMDIPEDATLELIESRGGQTIKVGWRESTVT